MGKIYPMPLGPDGEPAGEGIELERSLSNEDFDWGEDWGLSGGLGGGPEEEAGAEGSTKGKRWGKMGGSLKDLRLDDRWIGEETQLAWDTWSWSTTITFSVSSDWGDDEMVALMLGWTVPQLRDWRAWAREREWLERLTGDDWTRV